jgi:iron complex outermembrane receptor protein
MHRYAFHLRAMAGSLRSSFVEKTMKIFKLGIIAAAAGQLSSPGFAQAPAETATAATAAIASAAQDHDRNEEVIVVGEHIHAVPLTERNSTGSRLDITALETPATIQTLAGDMLRLRGDTDVVRAVARAAGIAAMPSTGSGGYGFSARGFGSSSVTLLYDGMKSLINTGSTTYPYDTWNVERIEVLNGPASVLYGGGAIGAAVNIIPRKPSSSAGNTLYVAGGSDTTWQAAVDSTGPLAEDLLYRIDVSRHSSDGYVQRGESDSTSVTAALEYIVSDTLDMTLSVDYGDRDGLEYLGAPLIGGRARESLRHINYSTYDGDVAFTDYRGQLLVEWRPSAAVSLRNASTYLRGERIWKYASRFVYRPATSDILRGGYGIYTQHQDQVDNHTEISWNHLLFGLNNRLAVGTDLVRLSNDRYVDSWTASDVIDLRNSAPGRFPTSAPNSRNYQDMTVHQYSVFAEDRVELNDRLSAIAGVRFDHSKTERENLVDGSAVEKTYRPDSWRAGVVYQLVPDFNVYAQYATAVDPVSNLCCISAAQMDFAMSEGKQTEIGLKQSLWNGRLEWSLAAYDIAKNKLLTPDPVNLGQSQQVGEQSSRGVEAAIAWNIDEAWRVELNGTMLRARYEDFSEAIAGVLYARDGNRPINTPERSANLWVTWSFAPQWRAQAGARYVGGIYANTDNSQSVDGYTVVDAGLHWDVAANVGLDLRAKNLFDRFYAYSTVGNGANGGQLLQGPPRTVDAALTVRF